MKRLLPLLLILVTVGILWIVSGFWKFDENEYVNETYLQRSRISSDPLDIEFLKQEFEPAYEF